MQTLLDNGYSNVFEMNGGFTAWTQAGYAVVTNIILPDEWFTKVTSPFTLIPNAANGTLLPTGAVITHWANGITEVTGADNKRIMLVRDADAPTQTTSSGNKPVTWIYSMPAGTTVESDSANGIQKFTLDGNVILTIINSRDVFTGK